MDLVKFFVALIFMASVAFADEDEGKASEETCQDNSSAAIWCQHLAALDKDRRGCDGFWRLVSSSATGKTIVFKLLENLWHNCPKTCFNCNLHDNPRVPTKKIEDSERYLKNRIGDSTLTHKIEKHSPTVDIDRWLEVNAVLEHLYVCENAEDAAQDEFFDETKNMTICEKWKSELKTGEFQAVTKEVDGEKIEQCEDIKWSKNTDALDNYNLPPSLKDGMHWWCRETCQLCRNKKDVVSHRFFSF